MPASDAPLDILAIMAHPDDAELLCGGTLIKSAGRGKRVGVLDLTAGEMGGSGSAATRGREATAAAGPIGLAERRFAGLPDSALENDHAPRPTVPEHTPAVPPGTGHPPRNTGPMLNPGPNSAHHAGSFKKRIPTLPANLAGNRITDSWIRRAIMTSVKPSPDCRTVSRSGRAGIDSSISAGKSSN